MLCSDCNKNNAEIFINKIENGVSSMEGLCRDYIEVSICFFL